MSIMSQQKQALYQNNQKSPLSKASKMQQASYFQENSSILRSRVKKIYYKNDHQQQQFFSIQRESHQPSRHFSPIKQQLELPIVKGASIGEQGQKRVNELKSALHQPRRYRNGSLFDNYYKVIEDIKKKHNLDEEDNEVEEYTYQTNNPNKELANALFNITTPSIQQATHHTSFNLDIHLWHNKQKQTLHSSLFSLAPIPNPSTNTATTNQTNQINQSNQTKHSSNYRNNSTNYRNVSLPPATNASNNKTTENSSILNLSAYNQNSSIKGSKHSNTNNQRKLKTQQSSPSPNKSYLLENSMDFIETSPVQPQKKILEINFATGMSKRYHPDNLKGNNQIIKTPYIDKAIQIIEEKRNLDKNGDDDDQQVRFSLREEESKKKVDESKDPFIKIDGGYGDYILRYHHIKQRIQHKLIPEKVAKPELKNIFNTYQDYENELFQQQLQKQIELQLMDSTPILSSQLHKPQEILFKV